MFSSSRMLARSALRTPVRSMSSAKGVYKEASFKDAWLSDSGAYPVMSVIGFAIVFSGSACLWFMFTHPDSRLRKTGFGGRKEVFRIDPEIALSQIKE